MEPLDGLRILECGELVTAPYCGKLAADLGAEVIKVESPGQGDKARRTGSFFQDKPGPDRSGLFLYLNNNKLGITLEPSNPTGRQVASLICQSTDIRRANAHRLNLPDHSHRVTSSQFTLLPECQIGMPPANHRMHDAIIAAQAQNW